jgi:hypothetical protein
VRSNKTVSAVFIPLVIGFFLAAAVACALAALLPIKPAYRVLGSIVTVGHIGQTIAAIKLRLLAAAVVSVLLTLAIVFGRASLASIVDRLPEEFRSLAAQAVSRVAHGLKNESSFHIALICVVGILAIGLRLLYLFQPMCGDESWTFDKYASMPLYIGLTRYTSPNNHLFHTLLVHISYLIFGNHPWAIRLPALIAGILIIPMAYLIISRAAGKYAAILAAGLMASSSALIMYSTNARGHLIVVLIFELNVLVGLAMLDDRSAAVWVVFGLLNAIGLFTVPVMLYPFGATVLWLTWLAGLRWMQGIGQSGFIKDLLKSLTLTAVVALVLYAPVLVVSGPASILSNKWVQPLNWHDFAGDLPGRFRATIDLWVIGLPKPVYVGLVLGGACALLLSTSAKSWLRILATATVLWVVPVLFIQRVFIYPRLWLFFLPVLFGLGAAGITGLLIRYAVRNSQPAGHILSLVLVLICVWCGVFAVRTQAVYKLNENDSLRDAEAITLFLKDYLRPGDKVVAESPSDNPLGYYFGLHDVSSEYLTADADTSTRILVVVNNTAHQSIQEVLTSGKRVIAVTGAPTLIRATPSGSIYQFIQPAKL